mgnify:CR=1 FL=1
MKYHFFILTCFFTACLIGQGCSNGKQQTEDRVSKQNTAQQDQSNAQNRSEKGSHDESYHKKGRTIVKATMGALKGQLGQAIAEGGAPHAIRFCNVHAMSITDSMSQAYDVDIARVSDRNRNPKNATSDREEDIMKDMRGAMEGGQKPKPMVVETDDKVVYYHPIPINNGLCLNCHGTPGAEINEKTLAAIDERYPNDQAKGYAMNDLRGLWKIQFAKSEEAPTP